MNSKDGCLIIVKSSLWFVPLFSDLDQEFNFWKSSQEHHADCFSGVKPKGPELLPLVILE